MMKGKNPFESGRRLFDLMSNSPECWISKALELLYSSKLLENNIRKLKNKPRKDFRFPISWHAIDTNQMIRGMALECLFKSIILINGNQIFENDKIKNWYKTHDLNQLAQKAKLDLSPIESDLLRSLSEYMIVGRYPVNASVPSHKHIDKVF